jgi:hypothetical protein
MANKKPYLYSGHAEKRIQERGLMKEWVEETIENPDIQKELGEDETHYFKRILALAGRWLKVVFNPIKHLVVTAHIDRGIKQKEVSDDNDI